MSTGCLPTSAGRLDETQAEEEFLRRLLRYPEMTAAWTVMMALEMERRGWDAHLK